MPLPESLLDGKVTKALALGVIAGWSPGLSRLAQEWQEYSLAIYWLAAAFDLSQQEAEQRFRRCHRESLYGWHDCFALIKSGCHPEVDYMLNEMVKA